MEYKIPNNAKIISIDSDFLEKSKYNNLTGLRIETDKGTIKILIDDNQQCCEDAGCDFLETPDDISKFIGAKVIKVEDVCIGLSSYEKEGEEDYETQLKITTNKGVLQYAVYNSHNGYYSHATFVQVFDKIEKDAL